MTPRAPFPPPPAYPSFGYGPGYRPPLLPPPGDHTFRGTLALRRAASAVVVATFLFVIADLLAVSAASDMQRAMVLGDLALLDSADATFATAAIITGLGALIAIVGICFGLYRFYQVSRGKKEFGTSHARSVGNASGVSVAASVAYFALFAWRLSVGANLDALVSADTPASAIQFANAMGAGIMVEALILLVATVVAAVALHALIRRLLTARGRKISRAFVAASVLAPLSALLVALAYIPASAPLRGAHPDWGSVLMGYQALDGWMVASSWVYTLADILGLIGLAQYVGMVGDAERGAKNMIRSGRYDPDANPAVPAWEPAGRPTDGPWP